MHRYQNIAITGARQAGKSTLARWLLEQLGLPAAGFRTEKYAVTPQGPLYALVDLETGASVPISRLLPEGIRGIPGSFDGFGAQVVCRARLSAAPVVLLDEIGRFERESAGFLAEVTAALDSEKTVIAVLKQENLAHLEKIKSRPDTLVVDLDQTGREQAREQLKNWMPNP